MRKALTLAAAVVVMHLTSEASAQEAFGSKGQVSLNSSSTSLAGHLGLDPAVLTPFVAFGRTELPGRTVETPNEITVATEKRTVFLINPGIDVFVIDHLSIGGEVMFAVGSSKDETKVTDKRNGSELTRTDDGPSSTTFGIMPRIGYDIPISRSFSIWPRGGFGFAHTAFSQDIGGTTIDSSEKSWLLFADVMFNWHPSDKFFLGIGPGFSHSLARSSTSQTPTGDITVDRPSITNFRFLGFTIGGVIN